MLKRTLIVFLLIVLSLLLFIVISGGGFGKRIKTSVFEKDKITYIAHRGLFNYYAENSFEGYDRCRKMGFKAVETDVRVTNDNRIIIFHDDSTQRLLGINSVIDELSLETAQSSHLLFNGSVSENKIMTLSNFLIQFQDNFVIYLDNKVNKKWVADSLLQILDKRNVVNSVIVASSNLLFLSYIKYKNPKVYTALEGFNSGKEWIYNFIPKNYKPDYYSSFFSKVDFNHIEFLKNNDLLDYKIIYGVDRDNINSAINSGLQNMILDFDSSFIYLLPQTEIYF